MNIFLWILVVIVAIIVLLLIIGLFTKKTFTIERKATINRPVPVVFDYLKHIKNQDEFNPWSQMDPAMEKTYRGTDGTVGFVSGWESHMVKGPGKGEQEIKAIDENKRLDVELRFMKPFASTSPAWFTTEPADGNKTHVRWGIICDMKYPTNIMLLFMPFEKTMASQLDSGLGMLKTKLENQ